MTGRALRVVVPGPASLIQDLGRPGLEPWGVPPSGAFDRAAHARAQRLVGNAPSAAGLEVLLGGLEVLAEGDLVVAVTGASCPVAVSGRAESAEVALYLRSGCLLRLGTARTGLRAYVAVRGGLAVPVALGSRSRDVAGAIGPEPVTPGDALPVGIEATGEPRYEPASAALGGEPDAGRDALAELVPGPHDDLLDDAGWRSLEATSWRVGERSDRMGVRLVAASGPGRGSGRTPASLGGHLPGSLPSFPVVPGSVQLTPSAELVVLGPDAGVTGGYPVLGVVSAEGLDTLAQCRPGTTVRLRRRTRRSPSRGSG